MTSEHREFSDKNRRDFLILSLRTLETSGVGRVGPNLVVDLDQALHDNGEDLLAGQSILQPVTEEDGEREGLPELVGAGRGAGSLKRVERFIWLF